MTNILDIHRTGGRRRQRRSRWTVPEAAPAADGIVAAATVPEPSEGSAPAPAFRRLVVFGSVDATAKRPTA